MSISPTSSPKSGRPLVIPAESHDVPAAQHRQPTASPHFLPQIALDEAQDALRRPSIQFSLSARLPTGRTSSPKPPKIPRRFSSPPPPPVFQPRVSFDTFDKPTDNIGESSFTLITKHKDYEYTKRSRTFLCGLDSNDYSDNALEWLIDELVDDGDEIVCLRVVEKDSSIAGDPSVEERRYRAEAEELMKHIQARNTDNKAINLVLEFSVGKIHKIIDEMIRLYEPAALVVGTRGRSLGGLQGLLPGSVSKYCLQHSAVPVIVVRPNSKRAKEKKKREMDPSRHAYRSLLDKSGSDGGHVLDRSHRHSYMLDDGQPASDDEAAAVAAAIGYKPVLDSAHPLSQVQTAHMDAPRSPDSSISPTEPNSPGGVVMKSPELQTLESPTLSEESSDSEDKNEGGVSAIVDPAGVTEPVPKPKEEKNDSVTPLETASGS